MNDTPKTYTLEVTGEELRMMNALALMHYTGMIAPIHPTHRPTLEKLAEKLAMESVKLLADNVK